MNYKELEQLFTERRITRRQFLAGAAAMGALSMVPGIVTNPAFAAPKKGGRLRVAFGHGSTTDSLDPATFENDHLISTCYAHHNHIGEVIDTGEIVPELAESWETDDARRWVIKLRRGVEFHNGKEMKADDVIASINHHRGDTPSPAKSLLEQIDEIRKQDDYTVVFNLQSANADFLYVLSDYHVVIKPVVSNGKIDPTDGIGAGPYVIQSFEPGERIFMTRHPNYWKENRAHFDEIENLSIHDQSARTNALLTDEVDLIDRVDLRTVDRLKSVGGVNVEETVGYRHYTFAMRTDMDPFTDNHIRMALKLGIDREQVMNAVLRGHGTIGNDHPISPKNRYHADHLEQRQYDPDQARWHLKQAGAEGLQVALSAADAAFPGAVDAASLYREHAAKAGIDLQVQREPDDGYWSDVWMTKPFCAVYWSGRVTEDWMFTTTYAAEADWNDTFWKHERFNMLLKEARAELDESKRAEMYGEMQKIVRDEGGTVIPMFANYVFGMRDRVQHDGNLAGNWTLDGMKFSERWWMA